jgi:glutathione S-transferase
VGWLNDAHSWSASVLRGGRGLVAQSGARQPARMLEIYEFEGCPFCRKVRDVMSELDLEYVARTSARGSAKRDAIMARGCKHQFPYLVDPNTGSEMYESEDIIDYLCKTYGEGRAVLARVLSPVNTVSAALASAARPRGSRVRARRDVQPEQLLELYNFEASPYCRKVREVLNELDLDYVVHNVAKRSARRPQLVARGGKMMVPYLIDPNTKREMYESDDIIAYLDSTYG